MAKVNVVQLSTTSSPFAFGGNRLCFVDPLDSSRCIKILRSDRLPATKKAEQTFPRNLKPQKYFDDNWQEWRVYKKINRVIGEAAYELIPRCYGFIETDLGMGLVSDIILDQDNLISLSLKQYIWVNGKTDAICELIDQFVERWSELGMPSRNLLLHNVVVQVKHSEPYRLYVIDGLGWPDLIPLGYWFKTIAQSKAAKKSSRIIADIDNLLNNKINGKGWGIHGWLDDQQRVLPVH